MPGDSRNYVFRDIANWGAEIHDAITVFRRLHKVFPTRCYMNPVTKKVIEILASNDPDTKTKLEKDGVRGALLAVDRLIEGDAEIQIETTTEIADPGYRLTR